MDVNKFGRRAALYSFLIGTLFLVVYLIFKIEIIILPAFYFVFLAAICNMLLLLVLIIHLFIEKNKKEYLTTIGIVLANIPITLFYLGLVFN